MELSITHDFSDWSTIIKNLAQTIAIITGGLWVWYRFGLFRERCPSLEINNGINYIGENAKEYLLELYCIVENKGKTRKWMLPFGFKLFYLSQEASFDKEEMNDEISFKQVHFENELFNKSKYWVNPAVYIPFVDRESKKRFQFITSVPKDCKFLMLSSYFIDFNKKSKGADAVIKFHNEGRHLKILLEKFKTASFEEKVRIKAEKQGDKKGDYYYTQVTLDIENIKEQAPGYRHIPGRRLSSPDIHTAS